MSYSRTHWGRKPARKGFAPGQQAELREYIGMAWATDCRANGWDPDARCRGSTRCRTCAYCHWYEAILKKATGHTTSTECNAGRDYDFLMRDLEIIHGRSTKWQERASRGDAVRIIYELRKAVREHDIEEAYLQGVARRMLGLEALPPLEALERLQLIVILGEVKRFLRRRLNREPVKTELFSPDGEPNWDV